MREVEKALSELFPMEYSGLYLYNERKKKLELLIAHGFSEEERLEAERTAMDRHPGMVFSTGESIYIADTQDATQPFSLDSRRSFTVRCRLYIPIRAFGKIIGTFGIVSSKVDAFTEDDKELFRFLCELAGQVYTRIRIEEQKAEALSTQRKLSLIATHTDNAVVIADAEGKIEWVNEAFTQISGYTQDEVLGKIPGRFLQGKDTDPAVSKYLGESIRKKVKTEGKLVNYTKSGEPYIIYLQIFPVFDADGRHTNFIALQKDITQEEQAKNEILNQRARLSAIVSTIPDQLFVVNGEGIIEEVFVSRPDQLPYSTEQLLGANLIRFANTDWGPNIKRALPVVLAGRKVDPIEGSAIRNGQLRYYEIRLSKLDEQRILAVVRDITSPRLTQMERDRQTEFYQLISDLSTRLISTGKDNLKDSMLEFVSKIGEFFKLDKSSIVPFETPDSIGIQPLTWVKDSSTPASSIWENATERDYPWIVEQLTNRHTVYIPVVSEMPEEAEKERRMLADNQIQSLVVLPLVINRKIHGFFTAKTKHIRKWSESEIALFKLAGDLVSNAYSRSAWEQERERFRTIFENAAFGALIFGSDGRIRYANRYICTLLLSTSDQMHLQHFDSIFPPEFKSNQESNIEKITAKGTQESFELQLRLPDNKTKTMLSNAIHIEEAVSRNSLIVYTFSDISERIVQEQATHNALNIVSEQNKRLLNFSYIVSHNIRSHASNISGIADVLANEPEPEIQRQFIEGLVKSSNNLDSTLRHLNELLNIQSRVNIHKEQLSFFQVINRTLDTLVVDLKTNKVKIVNKIPDGFKLKSDKAYLDSIVLNLLSNAIKYRRLNVDPVITVEAGKRNSVPYFSIQDNGKGIDLEKYGNKLFGMFKTFHGNRDARGIGLFITRNQIEALGGTIEVESKVGEGTKFTVYLPYTNEPYTSDLDY